MPTASSTNGECMFPPCSCRRRIVMHTVLERRPAQTFQRYFGRLGGSRSLSYLSHIDKYCQRVRLQAGCMPSLTVGGVDNDCAYSMQQALPLSSGIEYSRQRQRHIHLCRLVTWLLLGFGNWRMTPLSYVSDVFTYIFSFTFCRATI